MSKLEFDDELSRVVEEFNTSPQAIARRARILDVLALKPGNRVLDVGSGPGHQAFEMASVVGKTGRVEGVDVAESAVEIARSRCSELTNVGFQVGEAASIPFDDGTFDAVMSSQVFEYLDDVPGGLVEIHRVLKPSGRVLIHDTDWGTAVWHSSDANRTARIMNVWDGHLADPVLPRTFGAKLKDGGFSNVRSEAFVQLDTECDASSASAILIGFIAGYVVSQGVSQSEADGWADDLRALGASGSYFCSWNEYIFTADKT